jgi:hypothetical protein
MPDITPLVNWGTVALWLFSLFGWVTALYRGKPLTGPLSFLSSRQLLVVAICVGLGLSSFSLYLSYTKNCKKWPSTKLETVYGRAYRNEEVKLDGKKFDHCTFENVTFRLEGEALYSFNDSHLVGGTLPQVRTRNDIVGGTLYLVGLINRAYPGKGLTWGQKDEQGNPVQ